MRLAVTAAVFALSVFFIPAHAFSHQTHSAAPRLTVGLVTVQTAAGPITVAPHLAPRFKALIADFVAHGYRPRSVGCYASSGHVPHSRHYQGAACDFDQTGWGKTAQFMYHAKAIIQKHGLRDGCDFKDCGHVDDGVSLRYVGLRRPVPAEHLTRHHTDSSVGG